MIEISVEHLAVMKKCATAEYPHECCGLLLGQLRLDAGITVQRVVPARNLAEAGRLADRYVVDPRAILQADKEARAAGMEIVGVYHSHPDHPARPSATDVELAWGSCVYVILSVIRGEAVEVIAWQLEGDRGVMMPVTITSLST